MKPTPEEAEILIEKHLNHIWSGDIRSDGVHRIIEIVRWAAKPAVVEIGGSLEVSSL